MLIRSNVKAALSGRKPKSLFGNASALERQQYKSAKGVRFRRRFFARPKIIAPVRTVVSGIVIRNGKLLLLKKKKTLILPGGKPKPGESDKACLAREFGEELSGTRIRKVRYFATFDGKSPNLGTIIKVRTYVVEVEGDIGAPSAEISEKTFVGPKGTPELSDVAKRVMQKWFFPKAKKRK